MSSALLTGAASITPPVSGKNTWILASSGSSQLIAIPAEWRRSYVTLFADGVIVYITLGNSSITADETATTTVASNAFTTHGTGECKKIPSGTGIDMDFNEVSDSVTHMAVKCSGAGGYVRFERSSGRVGL